MDYKKVLLAKINKLLNGEYGVKDFKNDYYDFYLDKLPENSVTKDEFMFFGDIQEKLDWTDENPDEESRKYGWMDYEQYIKYVRRVIEDFLLRGKYDSDKWGNFKLEILRNSSRKN